MNLAMRHPIHRARRSEAVRSILLFLGLLLTFVSLARYLPGCKAADSAVESVANERAVARSAILTVADAVKAVDTLCASVARAKRSAALAAACDTAYVQVRAETIVVAQLIDSWDSVASGKQTAVCLIGDVTHTLVKMYDAVHASDQSTKTPAVFDDAIALVSALPSCTLNDGGASGAPADSAPPDAATMGITLDAGAAGDASE